IKNFAVCTCHLKPTTAIKRQIELIARVSERALNMELTNGCSAHPKANLCTFRNRALSAAIWSACCPLALIQKVGKFGARPLIAGCVDVGDVVRDDLKIKLLGRHASCGDGKRSHSLPRELMREIKLPFGSFRGTQQQP